MEHMDAPGRIGSTLPMTHQLPSAHTRSRRKGIEQLELLLDYELRGAVRYRRFATVVMVGSASEDTDVKALLADHIRASDEVFDLSPNLAILMGETDPAGAMTAIHRFKSFLQNEADVRFSMASFPADARGTAELLWTAHRRLDEAKEAEPGAVVGG